MPESDPLPFPAVRSGWCAGCSRQAEFL